MRQLAFDAFLQAIRFAGIEAVPGEGVQLVEQRLREIHFSDADDRRVLDDVPAVDVVGIVAARVTGPIVEVSVHENQSVKQGDVLFTIEDTPFKVALDRADAQLGAIRDYVQGIRASYRQKLAELRAYGMPAPDDLVQFERDLEAEFAADAAESEADQRRRDRLLEVIARRGRS